MNIFITLDYEIFFGENQGTIDKTLIYPTDCLLQITRNSPVKLTFFIDIGFIIKLEENKVNFPHLEKQYDSVIAQIKQIVFEGHDCQLHIHPHWEKAIYAGSKWVFDYSFYKLSDFDQVEIDQIFTRYKQRLENLTTRKVHSFRAGGWCIQPFSNFRSSFEKNEILIDSSVFAGGKQIDRNYYYDFTKTPNKDSWRFSTDVCVEDKEGEFYELMISSYTYTFWFFWKLFILGNLFPKIHKPIGNGKPMPSALTRKRLLTENHTMCANIDGFFSSKLQKVVSTNQHMGYKNTLFLGHPKALTPYSIKTLKKFILKNENKFNFKTFSDFYHEISISN